MKYAIITALALPAFLATAAYAQETNTTAATEAAETPSSGLLLDTRTDQERIDFLQRVATAYFKEGDNTNAITAYERILEIDPLNREARFIIGHVYINAKQYADAEAVLLELIKEYPDDFQLKNNLAWLYATAEDPAFRKGEQAIRLAQEAIVLAPYDHHVWSTLSEAYYVTGDYEKAFRAIEHMAKIAMRYGKNITQEMVDGYNEQILKCKRAWDTEKELKGDDEPEEEAREPAAEAVPSPDLAADPAQ